MDPPEPSPRYSAGEGADPAARSRRRPRSALRGALGVAFPIAASFLFSFLVGLAGLALGSLSFTASVSMPSTCRILSTLFQVEYTEYFSGQTSYAVAESPKEALPHSCRPDFGAAWSTTLKFKVNESYSCRYTLGSNKADIHLDKLFNCTAEEPSAGEMLKRIFLLFSESFVSEDFGSERMLGYGAAGVVLGMLSSVFIIILLRSLYGLFPAAARWAVRKHNIRVFAGRFKRACLLVAYVSAVGWITLQYSRFIGLKELVSDSELLERFF